MGWIHWGTRDGKEDDASLIERLRALATIPCPFTPTPTPLLLCLFTIPSPSPIPRFRIRSSFFSLGWVSLVCLASFCLVSVCLVRVVAAPPLPPRPRPQPPPLAPAARTPLLYHEFSAWSLPLPPCRRRLLISPLLLSSLLLFFFYLQHRPPSPSRHQHSSSAAQGWPCSNDRTTPVTTFDLYFTVPASPPSSPTHALLLPILNPRLRLPPFPRAVDEQNKHHPLDRGLKVLSFEYIPSYTTRPSRAVLINLFPLPRHPKAPLAPFGLPLP